MRNIRNPRFRNEIWHFARETEWHEDWNLWVVWVLGDPDREEWEFWWWGKWTHYESPRIEAKDSSTHYESRRIQTTETSASQTANPRIGKRVRARMRYAARQVARQLERDEPDAEPSPRGR